jgi:hypothetical protein
MFDKPELTWDEAKALVDSKPHPKVTKESIEAKIDSVVYFRHDLLTICLITMQNGFHFVGKAAPASRENYDPEVGKTYAYDDAFRSIWTHEGYLLKHQLTGL